jgi:hypothetical protein
VLNDTQEIRPTPTPPDKRSPLYLLTGLIIGLLLGLIYAWVINPVIYENSAPASLDEGDKDIYRKTIAQVYAVTGRTSPGVACFRFTKLVALSAANP